MAERSLQLLDSILGAKSKVAALRVLFHSKLGFSGGTVAKRTGMGLLAIQNALADLERLGIVLVERGSVEHRFRLNFKHYIVQHGLRGLFEAEREMAKAIARDLRPLLDGLVVTAGLFGSFARGEAGVGSDIDLLVVVDTVKQRERVSSLLSDKLPEFAERYGLPLQPVIYESRRLANSSDGMRDFLKAAEQDWTPIAGEDFKQFHRMLPPTRTLRRRSA